MLPGGPTVVCHPRQRRVLLRAGDVFADDERPIWSQMSFSPPRRTFRLCTRGIEARAMPGGVGDPHAGSCCAGCCCIGRAGLDDHDIDASDRDRLLKDHRAPLRSMGRTAPHGEARPSTICTATARMDHPGALREMTVRATASTCSSRPVHSWPLPDRPSRGARGGNVRAHSAEPSACGRERSARTRPGRALAALRLEAAALASCSGARR